MMMMVGNIAVEWKWKRAKRIKVFLKLFSLLLFLFQLRPIVFFDCIMFFRFLRSQNSLPSRRKTYWMIAHTCTTHTRNSRFIIIARVAGKHAITLKDVSLPPSPLARSLAHDQRIESAIDYRTTPNVHVSGERQREQIECEAHLKWKIEAWGDDSKSQSFCSFCFFVYASEHKKKSI